MIVTKHLLSKFIDISGISSDEICKKLNSIGLEVESFQSLRVPDRVVVGKVVSKTPHPDAQKLSVCEVDVGEILKIVCGASNVDSGQFVAVALEGAILDIPQKGRLEIKPTKLRGVDSNGMLCSSTELGFPKINDGIMLLDESIGTIEIGKSLNEFSIFDNYLIEISITPNKGDCLCVLGVAREIGARFGLELKENRVKSQSANQDIKDVLSVKNSGVDASLLYRVAQKEAFVSDLEMELSLALDDSLTQCKIKNTLKYATYMSGVIFNAYSGKEIEIKKDENGLDSVYVDSKKESVIGILSSPIVGGENIILEASYIDNALVSKQIFQTKTNKDHALSYLSTRGSNPDLEFGMGYLCSIVGEGVFDGEFNFVKPKTQNRLKISSVEICNILGEKISNIDEILKSCGFEVKVDRDILEVVAPVYRHDIFSTQDIAEEVLRFYGIDNICSKPLEFLENPKSTNVEYLKYKHKRDLINRSVANGFIECLHYIFYSKSRAIELGFDELESDLLNPINNELDTLRSSLIPAMLDSVSRNKNFGFASVNLCEVGSVYDKNREEKSFIAFVACGQRLDERYPHTKGEKWDFYSFCSALSKIIGKFELVAIDFDSDLFMAKHKISHPYQSAYIFIDGKRVGYVSKLNPSLEIDDCFVCELDFDLLEMKNEKMKEFSVFQESLRDLSIVVDRDIAFSEIRKCIFEQKIVNLKDVYPLDLYSNDEVLEKNSVVLTIRFVLGSMEKTLQEGDIKSVVDSAMEILGKKFNALMR